MPRQSWVLSAWLIGTVGVATAALLLLLIFPVGREGTLKEAAKKDTPPPVVQATEGAPVVQPEEQPSGKVLDAERKASIAFAELETKLNQLPPNDTARRTALCQEFLRQHGTTIVASRVRVKIEAKDP